MEYTIKELAEIAKISTRSLRYYDQIGLLKPAKINDSGYRIYGENEVNLLQQILFYKELGLKLVEIKKIIYQPGFNILQALKSHIANLQAKRKRIDLLLNTLEKTIKSIEEGEKMKDSDKFIGFKEKLISENEEKYGTEIYQKYGKETVTKANQKLMKMTEKEYQELKDLEDKILITLKEAMETNDHTHPLAQKLARLHQDFLKFYWPQYHKEAHIGLVNMYLEDDRFTAYYDKVAPGATKFLKDAVIYYLENR